MQSLTLFFFCGFIFVIGEQVLDVSTITCLTGVNDDRFDAFARVFCWIHGSYQIPKHLQGKASNCHMDSECQNSHTGYYLWIPYALIISIVIAYVPYIIWEKVYEQNFMKMLIVDKTSRNMHISFKILR